MLSLRSMLAAGYRPVTTTLCGDEYTECGEREVREGVRGVDVGNGEM